MSNDKHTEKLADFLSSCTAERLEMLDLEFEENPEISVLFEKQERLYKQLLQKLSKEAQKILIDYDTIWVDILSAERSFYYKHGFADSMFLSKSLFGDKKDINFNVKIV